MWTVRLGFAMLGKINVFGGGKLSCFGGQQRAEVLPTLHLPRYLGCLLVCGGFFWTYMTFTVSMVVTCYFEGKENIKICLSSLEIT